MPQVIENTDTFRKLNRETGKIEWRSLAPQLEQGALVFVDKPLDLVRVAYSFARDDKTQVAQWLETGEIRRVEADQAARWDEEDPVFWAVVVAPWVLIQPVSQD